MKDSNFQVSKPTLAFQTRPLPLGLILNNYSYIPTKSLFEPLLPEQPLIIFLDIGI